MLKKDYISPEFEILKLWLLEDSLSLSTGDVNHDYNDLGDGDDLFEDETNPDVNNDNYDFGDDFGDLFN